jgi:hypothetical protein
MKTEKWYWYTFADGYRVLVRGFSAQERKVEEQKHGRVISKVLDR